MHKAVGLDRRRDPERIIAVLREIDADIIALQEADLRFGQRPSVIPRALLDDTSWVALPVAKRRRSIGWHGNALLLRRDIDFTLAGALDLPVLEPRGAVFTELRLGGRRFQVAGAHLDISGFRRSDQVRAIVAALERNGTTCPQVVMGDFNHWGRDGGAMREFGQSWSICAPGPSFPSRRPIARLDRIIVSSEWKVIDAAVHHSRQAMQASDHLPVWARLELPKK
ncbi:endonuclease/exonuclease/phosphatase family protein [Erythrobacter sp. JK5]|uniref:endonuclease/exonuclease/phosphatase family protein n=1 Tax=Erythrobacter sp. JK5 TaxID=2829500 RepID=UPI0035303C24